MRRIPAMLVAAGFAVAWSTVAHAEPVAPGAVKFEENAVAASLTGSAGNAAEGRKLFANRRLGNCLACHQNSEMSEQLFHGEVGPDLTGVASRWKPEELRAIVANPKKVFGEETVMPAFYTDYEAPRTREEFKGKTILTAEQVEDVVAYLATLTE